MSEVEESAYTLATERIEREVETGRVSHSDAFVRR